MGVNQIPEEASITRASLIPSLHASLGENDHLASVDSSPASLPRDGRTSADHATVKQYPIRDRGEYVRICQCLVR